MKKNTLERLHHINYLVAETNALYHQASFKLGISDSVMHALYTIYDSKNSCLLSDIYKQSGISKQTVNSAIRKLEKEEILYLEQDTGRGKRIYLTDKGKNYVEKTVARLFTAEYEAFATWTEEEINTHIHLMEKYVDSFQCQVKKL